jgi:hypothetical protein
MALLCPHLDHRLGMGNLGKPRLALAWTLVPSSATVPQLQYRLSRATPSTRTNSVSIA